MTDQKLTELILNSIELEKLKKKMERDLERVKERRAKIRAIIAKYQDIDYQTEMIGI